MRAVARLWGCHLPGVDSCNKLAVLVPLRYDLDELCPGIVFFGTPSLQYSSENFVKLGAGFFPLLPPCSLLHRTPEVRHDVVLYCRYQEGVTGSKLFRDIGNVTEETKFSFEYSTRPPSEVPAGILDGLTELPFQVQIRYTRLNGMQCVRVITRSQVC